MRRLKIPVDRIEVHITVLIVSRCHWFSGPLGLGVECLRPPWALTSVKSTTMHLFVFVSVAGRWVFLPTISGKRMQTPHYCSRIKELCHQVGLPGLKSMSYTDRLKELNLWSLEERRNRADLIEVFRICHGQSAWDCMWKLFERVTDSKTRGHSLKLKQFRCKLDLRKYFFSERFADRWNSFDEDTVSACI